MATKLFERQTSKGLLEVYLQGGQPAMRFGGGALLPASLDKLPQAAVIGGREFTHVMWGRYVVTATEAAQVQAAVADFAASPAGVRAKLVAELAACERGAYPGTAAHARESRALKALAEFDAAQPEVLAGIRSEHSAKMGQSGSAPNSRLERHVLKADL